MNPSDVQSETEPRYFDPEEIDMSEQQFAASLEAESEKPQFEIDSPEDAPSESHAAEIAAGESAAVTKVEQGDGVQPRPMPVSCDLDIATSDPQFQPAPEADWRSMVSAKVSSYKARKPHTDRYPSLKLQFDPPVSKVTRELQTFASVEKVEEHFEHADEIPSGPILIPPVPLPDPPPPPRVVMEATARVIEFPRPAARTDELADPVIERPRIVEAPELLPPPPAMGGILIEEEHDPESERRPGFDVPLQPASLNRRVAAGLMDSAIVMAAVAIFGYVFVRLNGAIPPMRLSITIAAGLMAIFWPAYQYAFLVYSGRTPGLWAARLHLARFDGRPALRNLRRWRVLASVLSLVSLGLGYAWCFLDEDQLSWHDRITKTHLAP